MAEGASAVYSGKGARTAITSVVPFLPRVRPVRRPATEKSLESEEMLLSHLFTGNGMLLAWVPLGHVVTVSLKESPR